MTKENGPRVVVTRVRQGLELRVDGTLASLDRGGSLLTGTVWWALAAPVILLPPGHRRVLLLGLGAGSVAHVVRALAPSAELVGVENDREVLRVARRHFGLDRSGVDVVCDDAFRYLRRERRRFDLIVEDLFVGPVRSVHKPAGLLDEGYRLMRDRLRTAGLVTSNTIHETPAVVRAMHALGWTVVSLAVRGHWNHVLVAGPTAPRAADLRRRLRGHGGFERLLRQVNARSA